MNFKQYYNVVNFDVGEGASKPLFVTRGDTKSRGLYIYIHQNKTQVTELENLNIVFSFKRPDGLGDIILGVIDEDRFRIDFTNRVFQVPGIVQAELVLLGVEEESVTSRPFVINVRKDLTYETLTEADTEGMLQFLIQFVEEDMPEIRQSELDRISAEEDREEAEGLREQAEEDRENAEEDREDAEELRDIAEGLREEAEEDRENAEGLRQSAEEDRIANMEIVEGWIDDPDQFIGEKGDSFEYTWNGTELGVKTDKDATYTYVDLKGEIGEGLKILGGLSDPSQLPSSGSVGDTYLIEADLYVWTGTQFVNTGNIKGPKGDDGADGIQGPPGPGITIGTTKPTNGTWWYEEIEN